MAKLTAKQEAFAQAIADGMSQADAYRKAYDAGKMTDRAVWEEASKLSANHKVATRVAELKSKTEKAQLWTREQSIKVKITVLKKSLEAENLPVALKASESLDAMHGFTADVKLQVTGANGAPLLPALIVEYVGAENPSQ